jgi:hypothetical protein
MTEGRNGARDALDMVLDVAAYLTQLDNEIRATRARTSAALHLHQVPDGETHCPTCIVTAPCPTREALTQWETLPGQPAQLTVSTVHPVEEIAVHPASLDALKASLKLHAAETRLGNAISEIGGIPIVFDPGLAVGAVRMRPRGFDAH